MKIEMLTKLQTKENLISLVTFHAEEGLQFSFHTPAEIFPITELKINKLVCEVAAFANTIGGTIIYGIEKKRNKAVRFVSGSMEQFPVDLIRYNLENKICKRVEEISIDIIQIGETPEESVLVINVPESKSGPHMSFDKIYYKRQVRKLVPMEEFEVRMAYGKLSRTSLEFVGVFNTNGIPTLSNGKFTTMMFLPRFMIRNTGHVIEKYCKFEIGIPSSLCDDSYYALNTYFTRHEGVHNIYTILCKSPLFQDELYTISEAKLLITKDTVKDYLEQRIFVTLFFTDGVRSSEFFIADLFKYNDKVLKIDDFTI